MLRPATDPWALWLGVAGRLQVWSSQPDEVYRAALREEPTFTIYAAARDRGDARADAHNHDNHGAGRDVRGSIDVRDGLLQAQVQGVEPLQHF